MACQHQIGLCALVMLVSYPDKLTECFADADTKLTDAAVNPGN